jgi:hypothetical protein
MVKRRQKPISDSEISTLHHHPASKQGGVKTALTIEAACRAIDPRSDILRGSCHIVGDWRQKRRARTSLIVFRHSGENKLVQCGILYDVTRTPRTIVNCYELQ